ncbi:ATP-binding protein [Undibacterium sp. 5I1]|uniref:ATP-binding protein n=1 Tax=unclassified Undibacterium TaxID=2630295 RepID=UPI002AB4D8EA|nr:MULTISPECIES: ATP-binding protein [unclassified Undibacterium]MDY7538995.1 ATP-binding protein [Undibacterium sp. 5I1]MEB0233214.1 ATP-binding protein [Undibacterium sp. 10I3]MEB0258655.1 ATP-binding protein [Undibacterium sp. 5I1]
MDIETSSAIKLFFPNPSLSLVYFEAIANALDAGATDIQILIAIEAFTASDTLSIQITDNGKGFTEESFERFKTLMKPKDTFHKGIGRLVFLNYFENVAVTSEWANTRRRFIFKERFDGKSEIEKLTDSLKAEKTTLLFKNFSKDKVKSYDDLRPGSLKEKIVSHFMLTLNDLRDRNVNFKIDINLETKESNAQKEFFSSAISISSDDLPQMKHKVIFDETIDAHSNIDMHYYIKTNTSSAANLLTAVSIDGRTIPISLIQSSSIPYGNSAVFIFSSDLFWASADTSRQRLILAEGLSESALYSTLRREIGTVLAENIPEIAEKNMKTEKKFEEQFPHLLGYFDGASVGLIDGEDALNSAQQRFFKIQKEILQCENMTDVIYEKSLDASARTLTEYILYREKIIAKMKAMSSDNTEAEIHNLIVPRWENFQQDSIINDVYQNNAWLLDDKFMTFRTILSEARMVEVINAIRLDDEGISGENGRPDIAMIFSADPQDSNPVDVVVIEIKKKTDDEKENQYAINQLLDRAYKLAEHCPNIQRIWYYAVLQINDSFARSLRQQKWAPLFSKGKVYYQEFPTERPNGTIVPTPIFAMSFDAIVSDAQSRNHTFLEILRSGMKQQSKRLSEMTEPHKD